MTVWLAQAEADALFAMEKHRVDARCWRLPDTGGGIVVPLVSADGDEPFHLDISRGRINLAKGKLQSRARTTMVPARIDFGGAPHRNPDHKEIVCSHVHLYREATVCSLSIIRRNLPPADLERMDVAILAKNRTFRWI